MTTTGGGLANRSSEDENGDADYIADPIDPGDRTGFVVEAKAGAFDANGRLAEVLLKPLRRHVMHYFVRQDLAQDDDEVKEGLSFDIRPGRILSVGSDVDEESVLKIRILNKDLPDEYPLRIHVIELPA